MVAPHDLLVQAIELQKAAKKDLDYRNVIERAYYGAYHAALEFEEKLPHRSQAAPRNVGTHESLFQRLERPDPKLEYVLQVISKDIAAQMRMLKPLRELATYELKETIRIDQAEEAIMITKDILAECAKGHRRI